MNDVVFLTDLHWWKMLHLCVTFVY